jgi:hypothetical protein
LLFGLRGECAAALDRHDEAAQHFCAALEHVQSDNLQAHAWQVYAALATQYHRRGDEVRAAQAHAQAVRFLMTIAASLPDSARADLLRTPTALAVLAAQPEAE